MEYLRLKCDKCGWDAKKDLQIPVTLFLHVIENYKKLDVYPFIITPRDSIRK